MYLFVNIFIYDDWNMLHKLSVQFGHGWMKNQDSLLGDWLTDYNMIRHGSSSSSKLSQWLNCWKGRCWSQDWAPYFPYITQHYTWILETINQIARNVNVRQNSETPSP